MNTTGRNLPQQCMGRTAQYFAPCHHLTGVLAVASHAPCHHLGPRARSLMRQLSKRSACVGTFVHQRPGQGQEQERESAAHPIEPTSARSSFNLPWPAPPAYLLPGLLINACRQSYAKLRFQRGRTYVPTPTYLGRADHGPGAWVVSPILMGAACVTSLHHARGAAHPR